MNRKSIINLALNHGLQYNQSLEEFSSKFCEGMYITDLKNLIDTAIAREREACAKLCDHLAETMDFGNGYYEECAESIRARSKNELCNLAMGNS